MFDWCSPKFDVADGRYNEKHHTQPPPEMSTTTLEHQPPVEERGVLCRHRTKKTVKTNITPKIMILEEFIVPIEGGSVMTTIKAGMEH